MSTRKNILITHELSDDQLDFAENLGLNVLIEPALRFEYRNDWFALDTILRTIKKPVFAFTSRNGVEGFQRYKDAGAVLPDKTPAYAVGKVTAEALQKAGMKAKIPVQQDGTGLAQKIVEDFSENPELEKSTILHFCGDRRRDEFRQFLRGVDIEVRDVVVYKTILNPMNIPKNLIDGILFFSPSAVEAFRNSGGFLNQQIPELFAIGNTTAEELSIESGKHVHISPEPDTESILTFTARVLNEK